MFLRTLLSLLLLLQLVCELQSTTISNSFIVISCSCRHHQRMVFKILCIVMLHAELIVYRFARGLFCFLQSSDNLLPPRNFTRLSAQLMGFSWNLTFIVQKRPFNCSKQFHNSQFTAIAIFFGLQNGKKLFELVSESS